MPVPQPLIHVRCPCNEEVTFKIIELFPLYVPTTSLYSSSHAASLGEL